MEYFRTRKARADDTLTAVPQSRLDFSGRTALTRTAPSGEARALFEAGRELRGGRYRVVQVLGSGGEGVVYRVHDALRGEEVAMKVLHLEDGVTLPQLKREFRFLRDLVHPNLLPLYELVVERELSFFTMSYVQGEDFLKSVQAGLPLSSLALQLADVLTFLHRTGRVHRDVKPTNILVRPSGELVLLDFGIGLDLRARRPEVEAMTGTPRYMAPEVLAVRGASEKSDAYAMGIILYEALTGQHPQPSGRTQLNQTEGFDPRLIDPEIPEHWAHLVVALTEPDPQKRASVGLCTEILAEARSGTSHVSSLAPPVTGDFTGRRSELARLAAARDWVREGYSPFVVRIEAKSGMGKTALIQQFLEKQSDSVVFRGRCSEHELLPHKAIDGVVADLIDYLRTCPNEFQLEMLPERDANILVQLFPEFSLLPVYERLSGDGFRLGDYRAMRQRAYLALAELLARLSIEQSLIIAIDDLQWGDVDSGKIISEVFGGPDRPNCLLILAYRSEEKERSECLAELFFNRPGLGDDVPGTVIELGPLAPGEANVLVEDIIGSDQKDLVRQITAEAQGSPLLLTEMAAHVQARGALHSLAESKEVMGSIVSSRLDTLSEGFRQAFFMLCCSGVLTEVTFLSELAQCSVDALVRQLEQARLARTRHGGMWIEPLHDAIRESTLSAIASSAPSLHLRLAEALVLRSGDPAEITRHFFACRDSRTSVWAEKAADAAAHSFALSAAIDLYRLALRTAPPDRERSLTLRNRLADMLADAGRGAEAAPIYAQLAAEMGLDRAIELQRRAAEQWLITGDARRGTEVLARVHAQVGLHWPKSPMLALSSLIYHRGRLAFVSDASIDAALRSVAPKPSRQLAACRAAWPIAMISVIHGAANSSLFLRLALESQDRSALTVGCAMEAIYQAIGGPKQTRKVERWMQYARRATTGQPDAYARAFLSFAVGQSRYLIGDLAGSLAHFDEAERLFLIHGRGVAWELNSCRVFWTDSLFYLGHHRELDQRFSTWIADAEARGDDYVFSALQMARASRSILRDGDAEKATAEVIEGAARWNSPYVSYHHLSELVVRAFIHVYRGAPRDALSLMPQLNRMMKRSYMDQAHVARVQVGVVEALALLEAAADEKNSTKRGEFLQKARRLAQMMRAQGATWSSAFGLQFEAIAGLIEAPNEDGIERLRQAGALFEDAGMRLHAAGVSGRIGELVDGDAGKGLLDQCHSAFSQADIADWVAALSCLTPRVLFR